MERGAKIAPNWDCLSFHCICWTISALNWTVPQNAPAFLFAQRVPVPFDELVVPHHGFG